ncbi:MAG TPA: ABC transporter substrate-binding protein, partial [Myxococcaceae bacterium]|nr:ABC transporter substrate-binding protein [Myxococcaceae bacterium]
ELDEPFAPLLSYLAYPRGLMVSPEAVRRHGRDVGRHPSGTGPFQLESFEPGRRIVLRRNPSYWGPPPALERLVFRPLTDEMTRVAELRAGGVDLVLELSPDNVAWLRHTEGFQVHERSGPHLWFLILNTREPPLSDVRMRRALNYAIDKRALVEGVLQDTASVAAGPVPEAFDWAHDSTLRPYPYDPERARELVREAGQEGTELTFLVPQGGSGMLAPVQMATAIQADLAAIGLKARIETYEWNTYLEKVNAGLEGQGHLAEMAWMTNDPDTLPYLALRTSAHPPDGFNSGYYSNPEVDALLEQARTATDATERARLYREVQRRVHEDAPWVFVASWRQHAVTSARVRDFRLQPSFLLLLADTSKR